jgi:hypothetical protein
MTIFIRLMMQLLMDGYYEVQSKKEKHRKIKIIS